MSYWQSAVSPVAEWSRCLRSCCERWIGAGAILRVA